MQEPFKQREENDMKTINSLMRTGNKMSSCSHAASPACGPTRRQSAATTTTGVVSRALVGIVLSCALVGANVWADTTNEYVSGNLTVGGFVNAAGFGEQAGTNTVGAVNSIFIGDDAGYDATNAFASAVFGAFSTIPPGAQYQFVYGAYMTTNGATDFSHMFGHLGTNYVVFTKDGAFFNVPISGNLTLTNGTVNFTGANVTGITASQVGAVAATDGVANNLTMNDAATINGNLTVTNGTLRGASDQIILQVNGTDVAVGHNVNASGHGVAIGQNAMGTNYGVAVGIAALADGYGTALGPGANGTNEGVAVGLSAFAPNGSTAVGRCARATGGEAFGYDALVTGGGVAIGTLAEAHDCATYVGIGGSSAYFATAIGGWSQASDSGFAGGDFTRANGLGNIAIGGGIAWCDQAPAVVSDGYQDAIQLGRNRVSISTNIALAASHFLRVWGGVADGGMELNGQTGTLHVSNLTVQGAVALPPQGDIPMGSFTNGPAQ